jgi:16S rRNA (guanine966-N2)-methyltransferase
MVRVVGGHLGGRRLAVPPGDVVRPTSDRVRESIFDILESRFDLSGTVVADLFAGTGALGIEALSRGASQAIFVERHPLALAALRKNISALFGGSPPATVVGQAVEPWLEGGCGGRAGFDVVFADPPYSYSFGAWADLLSRLPSSLAVLETSSAVEELAGWEVLTRRRYGGTVVTLVRSTKPRD